MRIREDIKKPGFFWLPDKPGNKIAGILTIVDGGEISITTTGTLSSTDSLPMMMDKDIDRSIKRLHGHVENFGLVTLDDCFQIKHSYSSGVHTSTIIADQLVTGVIFDTNEDIKINDFIFSIEGIDEWVNIDGFNIKYLRKRSFHIRIDYKKPEKIIFKLDNDIEVSIVFSSNYSTSVSESPKISQKTFLKIHSNKAYDISYFTDIARKLTNFLCFANNATLCIDEVKIESEQVFKKFNRKKIPVQMNLFYQSAPFIKTPDSIKYSQTLFRFTAIQDIAEQTLNNWMNAYEKISPSLDLYFAVKSDSHRYLESQFLALAQSIETYHRRTSTETQMSQDEFTDLVNQIISSCPSQHQEWLKPRLRHGNELSLGQRIKSTIDPFKDIFGNNSTRSKLVRDITNTRNYLTHYDPSMEESAVSGLPLLQLCEKMELILQLHILQILGFPKKTIYRILKKNTPSDINSSLSNKDSM